MLSLASGKVLLRKYALLQRKRFIMRKQTYTMIAAVLVLGCLTVSANAQCGGIPLITKIPFQFSTGKATLPAGEYVVKCLDPNRQSAVVSKHRWKSGRDNANDPRQRQIAGRHETSVPPLCKVVTSSSKRGLTAAMDWNCQRRVQKEPLDKSWLASNRSARRSH